MVIDFFKKSIKFQEMHKKPGMRIYNTIQTNGVLLDNEWCEFFRENHLVGISIDGPRYRNNVYRKDKKGNSFFDQVIHGLKLLKKA